MYKIILLGILGMTIGTSGYGQGRVNNGDWIRCIKAQLGLFVNIAADALVGQPDWGGELPNASREQIVRGLQYYVDQYAGKQVHALLFNVNYQRAFYESSVMDPAWTVKDPDENVTEWFRGHWIFHKNGVDPFELVINRSRSRKISPWLSFRMNDHHYFNDTLKINRLWVEHPELRKSQYAMFDYSKKEVRDYYKDFIREALDKYDVDGIELDWMRSHDNFKAEDRKRGMLLLNEFMKDIRRYADECGAKRGHPIKVAVRVPSSPAIARSFGLDPVAWVKSGYVDAVIPSNWFHPTNFNMPIETWREEIGNGPSYLLIAGADNGYRIAANKHLKVMTSNVETMRGFAASALNRGADAIYFFNNFQRNIKNKVISTDGKVTAVNDRNAIMGGVGKAATIKGKPRTHVLTYTDPDTVPFPQYAPVLAPGEDRTFTIHSGSKPAKAEYVVRIGLGLSDAVQDANLEVKVNSVACKQINDVSRATEYRFDSTRIWHEVEHVSETSARVVQFKADFASIRDGYSQIVITNRSLVPRQITWLDIRIVPR